jgi:hypothetical protein
MNSLKNSINVPLMDVKNISELIAGYCCNYVYTIYLFQERRRGGYYMYEGIVSASSREECFYMIKRYIIDEDDEDGIDIEDVDISLKSKKPYFSHPRIIMFNIYNEGGLI